MPIQRHPRKRNLTDESVSGDEMQPQDKHLSPHPFHHDNKRHYHPLNQQQQQQQSQSLDHHQRNGTERNSPLQNLLPSAFEEQHLQQHIQQPQKQQPQHLKQEEEDESIKTPPPPLLVSIRSPSPPKLVKTEGKPRHIQCVYTFCPDAFFQTEFCVYTVFLFFQLLFIMFFNQIHKISCKEYINRPLLAKVKKSKSKNHYI